MHDRWLECNAQSKPPATHHCQQYLWSNTDQNKQAHLHAPKGDKQPAGAALYTIVLLYHTLCAQLLVL